MTDDPKYVTYDLEMEGQPDAYWHIYSLDRDKHDSLLGQISLLAISGPDTQEMGAAIAAIAKAVDVAVEIAEQAKVPQPPEPTTVAKGGVPKFT